MLKQNISALFNRTATFMICVLANVCSSQEPVDARLPAANGFEEIAATVVQQPPFDDGGVETLTRGPLHEAFAEPIVSDPVPGLIVQREPPADINEMPPEFRPEGDDAIWISGYWGWDEEREDFIWVSGVYRIPPEGRQWVPGYWLPVENGWQWVQGMWVEDIAETIVYLPPPPASLEIGPSSPSPSIDSFYIPGNWSQSSSSGYVWNAGYWHPLQADFIWVPAHTVWTPRGCIFINGYWDRRLPLRGLCFAPVMIPRATYSRPGWYLRPNIVLNAQVVLHNLFVQPLYNHYLFGDYYGLPLGNRNVYPAYLYHQRRGSFDPLISFYSAYNARQGQDMMRWYGNQYAELSRNPAKRPPQQWSPNPANAIDNTTHSNPEPSRIAHTLDQISKMDGGTRITPVSANIMQDLLKHDGDRKKLGKERVAVEGVKGKTNVLDSTASAGIVPPTFSLPKLDNIHRKTDLSSRLGKMPEQPRNINRDRLNPNDLTNKLQGNLNTRQGTIASPEIRRFDSLPGIVDPNRQLKPKTQNDLLPQAGRIPSLEQRGLDAIRRTDQLNRNSQAPEFRPQINRDLGIQRNVQGEIKNKLRSQQLNQPLNQPLNQQMGQPILQGKAPSPNSIRQLLPENQPRQEKQSKGEGNADRKDHGKKPKG